MKAKLAIDFDSLDEMLGFAAKLNASSAGTSLQTVLARIDLMANTEVSNVLTQLQAGFATLNEAQAAAAAEAARQTAATDRLLVMVAEIPNRIQDAVDAAVANGVDAEQLTALTALVGTVQGEVDEAQAEAARAKAEADRLEAVAPAPVVTPPADPTVDPAAPVVDAGSDTTGGGTPVPTPGA